MQDVKGKVAVVTGAASGIGRGIVESFAAAGMKVVLSDIESAALETTTRSLRAQGAEVASVVTDVSNAQDVERLAELATQTYGAVHVLCNNAGVGAYANPSWKATLDDWTWILGVNLMGVIHGLRAFLPRMIEQGTEAHVVNTASLAGLIPGDNTLYVVTKFAVVALSESVFLELQAGGFRPRISVLCPGWVNTNIMDTSRNPPAHLKNSSPVPTGPVADVVRDWFAEQLKHGLDPRAVGDQVLAAIREERFYILTHPEWTPFIEQRMKRILAGDNPAPSLSPQVESLRARLRALRNKPHS